MVARREFLLKEAEATNKAEKAKLDVTPVEVPLEYRHPPTIKEELQRYVRYEISRLGEKEGFETFEEADDFEMDDVEEPDWESEFEVVDMEDELPVSLDGAPSPEEAEAADRPASETDSAAPAAESEPPPAKE